MKDALAEHVLANVMGWGAAEVADFGARLQLLAAHKYDSYEGYRPGVKFLENLSGWLHQFDSEEDRRAAIEFVLNDLIFISRAELDHLIETVYPDFIRPMLIKRAAEQLKVSRFAVNEIVNSPAFLQMQRRTLVLGLSDGARIDRLRRSSPSLSHEQIFLATDIGDKTVNDALEKLHEVNGNKTALFEHVLLVDDFYGSGRTLLRENDEAKGDGDAFKGRLWRTHQRLMELANGDAPALEQDFQVSILVYIASDQAEAHVKEMMEKAGLGWELEIVQRLPASLRVNSERIARICQEHYDPILSDESKPVPVPLGYSDCALPLVLPHNTPNNSICILWADTTDQDGSRQQRALFPRYERHREDRK